jgi:hypothetical protein
VDCARAFASRQLKLKMILCIVDEIVEKIFHLENNFLDERIFSVSKKKCRCVLRAAASAKVS